ncbi:MAG: cation diffusion facilitator family transporter [Oscillospiraceae bacterium]
MNETKIINRLSTVGIAGNIALVVFKLYAGIAGHSGAMVSDAVHSLSDVFATLVAYIGVRISKKAPDQDHPYGHDRLECVASMILGMILLATGFGIGLNGVKQIAAGHYEQLAVPSAIALAAAVVSIVSKEVMFWYTRYYAKKLNSSAFMADAWHHRSDALSSVGSLIGIGGAMLGVPVMEPIACVAICLCILKVAYDILKDSIDKMLDTACSPEYEASLRSFIAEQDGVRRVDKLQTRRFWQQDIYRRRDRR